MATATSTPVRKTQDWLLSTVRESQKAMVDTISIWSSVVGHAAPATRRLSVAKQLPSARSVVDPSFDLAEKLLEAQRQFASSIADALVPARPRSTSKATRPTS